MNYLGEVRFVLVMALGIATLAILLTSVELTNKGWLVGFIANALLAEAMWYMPIILHSYVGGSPDTLQAIVRWLHLPTIVVHAFGWAMFLMFALKSRSGNHTSRSKEKGFGVTKSQSNLAPPYRTTPPKHEVLDFRGADERNIEAQAIAGIGLHASTDSIARLLHEANNWGASNGNPGLQNYPQWAELRRLGQAIYDDDGHAGMQRTAYHLRHRYPNFGYLIEHFWHEIGDWRA